MVGSIQLHFCQLLQVTVEAADFSSGKCCIGQMSLEVIPEE